MTAARIRRLAAAAGMSVMIAGTTLAPCVYAAPEEETVTESEAADTESTETDAEQSDDAEPVSINTGDAADTEDETSDGQVGDTIYSAGDMDRGDNAVAVTFNIDVPSDVTYPCIVTFSESESYEEYYVTAYKTAGYATTVYLDPGTYIITDGYPENDNISAYTVVNKDYFTVEENSTDEMVVNVTIRSKGDILRGDTGSTEEIETTATDTSTQSGTSQEKNYTIYYIIAAIVFIAIGVVIGVAGLKYLQKNDD